MKTDDNSQRCQTQWFVDFDNIHTQCGNGASVEDGTRARTKAAAPLPNKCENHSIFMISYYYE